MQTLLHKSLRSKPWSGAAAALVIATWPTALVACPLCESPTGQQVRAGILGGDFGLYAVATLLPFAVLLSIVGLVQFGVPPWRSATRRLSREPSPLDLPPRSEPIANRSAAARASQRDPPPKPPVGPTVEN